MKRLLILFAIPLFLSSCKKDDPATEARVSYSVKETSQDTPTYSVSYTADGKATKSVGGLSSSQWDSETVHLKRGDFVSFNVSSSSPDGDFILYVYLNGVLWESKEMHNPNGNVTISGDLP
ncbi:MAG: hypothetical protein FD123_1921 [Bacteroidetes bacterium]|nr:MAG: hypothetical protein FD123_1921 [Bacteroidota bacterium]